MKYFLLVLWLCCMNGVQADTDPRKDMDTLRREYIAAVESDEKTEALLKKLSQDKLTDPLLIAYKGALEALKAKHAFNPYTKMSYLKKSQLSLEQAISMRPEDVEMRFLRYSIQHYLPSFLRQSKNLEEDRMVIVKHITDTSLDKTLQQSIGKFMIESGRCTIAEVQKIRTILH